MNKSGQPYKKAWKIQCHHTELAGIKGPQGLPQPHFGYILDNNFSCTKYSQPSSEL